MLDNAVQNGSDASSEAVQSKFAYGTHSGNLGVASITETYLSSVTKAQEKYQRQRRTLLAELESQGGESNVNPDE